MDCFAMNMKEIIQEEDAFITYDELIDFFNDYKENRSISEENRFQYDWDMRLIDGFFANPIMQLAAKIPKFEKSNIEIYRKIHKNFIKDSRQSAELLNDELIKISKCINRSRNMILPMIVVKLFIIHFNKVSKSYFAPTATIKINRDNYLILKASFFARKALFSEINYFKTQDSKEIESGVNNLLMIEYYTLTNLKSLRSIGIFKKNIILLYYNFIYALYKRLCENLECHYRDLQLTKLVGFMELKIVQANEQIEMKNMGDAFGKIPYLNNLKYMSLTDKNLIQAELENSVAIDEEGDADDEESLEPESTNGTYLLQ